VAMLLSATFLLGRHYVPGGRIVWRHRDGFAPFAPQYSSGTVKTG
jgi:hypothetical protein